MCIGVSSFLKLLIGKKPFSLLQNTRHGFVAPLFLSSISILNISYLFSFVNRFLIKISKKLLNKVHALLNMTNDKTKKKAENNFLLSHK